MENTREQKLKYIFGANQDVEEFFVTSDDQAFRSENDATNHARTLADTAVKRERREDYISVSRPGKSKSQEGAEKREALVARHIELFGNEPAKNAKDETIRKKIEAEETRLAEEAAKDGPSDEEE